MADFLPDCGRPSVVCAYTPTHQRFPADESESIVAVLASKMRLHPRLKSMLQ